MSRFLAGTSYDRAQKVARKYPDDENMLGLNDQLTVSLNNFRSLQKHLQVGGGTKITPALTEKIQDVRDISRTILETASKIDIDQKLLNVQTQVTKITKVSMVFAIIATLLSGFAAWTSYKSVLLSERQATASEKANTIAEKHRRY
jgi:hypothetical protein